MYYEFDYDRNSLVASGRVVLQTNLFLYYLYRKTVFQATVGGRFALFGTLVDEDADLNTIVTHFQKRR